MGIDRVQWRTLELEALNTSPMSGTGTFSLPSFFSLRRGQRDLTANFQDCLCIFDKNQTESEVTAPQLRA